MRFSTSWKLGRRGITRLESTAAGVRTGAGGVGDVGLCDQRRGNASERGSPADVELSRARLKVDEGARLVTVLGAGEARAVDGPLAMISSLCRDARNESPSDSRSGGLERRLIDDGCEDTSWLPPPTAHDGRSRGGFGKTPSPAVGEPSRRPKCIGGGERDTARCSRFWRSCMAERICSWRALVGCSSVSRIATYE